MAWEQTPRGVAFTRQQIEYQQFPEEFFSGADVVIYFGDTWLADITGLQFELAEHVRPVYGYASYTWDVVKRGVRLVNGQFRIAFTEAGYLYRVLDHLGQLSGRVAPTLAHLLGGESDVPEWHADALQTIEDILGGKSGIMQAAPKFVLISPSEYEVIPVEDRAIMWSRDLARRFGWTVEWDNDREMVLFNGRAFKPYKVVDGKSYVYVRFVAEAFGYKVWWSPKTEFIIICPGDCILLKPEEFIVLPHEDRAVMDVYSLCKIAGIYTGQNNEKIEVASDSIYINGRKFDRIILDKITYNGVYIREVLENFNYGVAWVKEAECIVVTVPAKTAETNSSGNTRSRFETSMADYESKIWGDAFTEDRSKYRHYLPYFYSGEYTQLLQKDGFDIYITYGPLPYHVKQRLNVLPDVISYNTTVKAIRNVQLTGCGQILDPSGKPVEEVYTFVARDMD